MNKKGEAGFEKLIGFAVAFATLVIILIATLMVSATGRNEINSINGYNNNSVEYNATTDISGSMTMFTSFIPLVVITGIGVALIGMIAVLKLKS